MARKEQVKSRDILSVDIAGRTVRARNEFGQVETVSFDELSRREWVKAATRHFKGTKARQWQGIDPAIVRNAVEMNIHPGGFIDDNDDDDNDDDSGEEFIPPATVSNGSRDGVTAEQVAAMIHAAINGKEMPKPRGKNEPEFKHAKFDTVIKILTMDPNDDSENDPMHVWCVGPAGTGKTTLAMQVAEFFGIQFGGISLSNMPTKTDIFGFIHANGGVIGSSFRDCWENGGVYLFDEMDAGHAGDLAKINMALANGIVAFPDGLVKMHPDFKCIACANTDGLGADQHHVGRNRLDAATLDRFVRVAVEIDEKLEMILALNIVKNHPELKTAVREYVKLVQTYRKRVNNAIVISPRSSYDGAKLLKRGFTVAEIEDMRIFKGCSDSIKARAKAA